MGYRESRRSIGEGQVMARRSRSFFDQMRSWPLSLQMILVLGGLGFLINYIDEILPVALTILFGSSLLAGCFVLFRRQSQRYSRKSLQERLTVQMSQHEAALVSYFRQSISRDSFGNVDENKWHKHVETFLSRQVVPDVADYSAWRSSRVGCEAAATVGRFTRQKDELKRRENPLSAMEAHQVSASEYEQLCADILNALGWNAQVTQASRDHGADVIAEKQGLRVVIQCKRYSQPVGNKAVQEVHSALNLYAGDVGCVVAPSGFTPQARREANGLAVKLLHHSELDNLDEMLGTPPDRVDTIGQRAIAQ